MQLGTTGHNPEAFTRAKRGSRGRRAEWAVMSGCKTSINQTVQAPEWGAGRDLLAGGRERTT